MASKRTYEIAFVGFKPGIHEFNYTLDDKFFVEKGATDITGIKAQIKLLLGKKTGFMLLKFEIDGSANVICDRCGNTIKQELWDEFNVLVKLVENPDEMNEQEEDPDVFYIARTESHLDVSNWLYEFVLLSVPMQRMCKADEIGGPKCNVEVLEKLKAMEAKAADNNSSDIWKGLDQFKKANKNNL